MSKSKVNNVREEDVKKLCKLATGRNEDEVDRWYTYVLKELQGTSISVNESASYEFSVETYLKKEHRFDDLVKFAEQNRKFQANKLLSNKDVFLQFLVRVCEEKKALLNRSRVSDGASSVVNRSAGETSSRKSSTPKSLPIQNNFIKSPTTPVLDVNKERSQISQAKRESMIDSAAAKIYFSPNRAPEGIVSERAVIQELLYAFQGIGGSIFKDDLGDGRFRISTKVPIPLSQHAIYLSSLGSLYVKTRKIIDNIPLLGVSTCRTALATAMRSQLNEFSRLISEIESQLHDPECNLTLLRVRCLTSSSYTQMKWLATVAEACKDTKGGELLTQLHGLMQHGDSRVSVWLTPLLSAASRPFYNMLRQWLKQGNFEDSFGEFFISIDSAADKDEIWNHRYSIREEMRPSFITKSQANTILVTGKSFAFVHDFSSSSTDPFKWSNLDITLDKYKEMDAPTLWKLNGELQLCIEAAHKNVSHRALRLMLEEGKLSLHLQALKHYLLLGQGDFVKQLIENLSPKLTLKAPELSASHLTSLLDSAIRATNAQFDDPEVLESLDVKLMQMSKHEIGWDIFSLSYNVKGPVAMIITHEVASKYISLFMALFRAKRMEWILSNLWRRQTVSTRLLRKISELTPALQQILLLISEMNHFISQIQYYLLFESVECQWSEFQTAITNAPSLDHLITAHNKFLDNIERRALLDRDSGPLLSQLRSIYNSVTQLESIETKLSDFAHKELERRNELIKQQELLEKEDKFGISEETEIIERKLRKIFISNIKGIRSELRSLSASYRQSVTSFLLDLASNKNEELNCLSYRLDFNEYYKKSDKRLSTSFTVDFKRRNNLSTSFLMA